MEYDITLGIEKCTQCGGAANSNPEFPQCCTGFYLETGTTVCEENLDDC